MDKLGGGEQPCEKRSGGFGLMALNRSKQCALAARGVDCVLGCIRHSIPCQSRGRWLSNSFLCWGGFTLNPLLSWAVSGASIQEGHQTVRLWPRWGEASRLLLMRKLGLLSLEKRMLKGDPITVCTFLKRALGRRCWSPVSGAQRQDRGTWNEAVSG